MNGPFPRQACGLWAHEWGRMGKGGRTWGGGGAYRWLSQWTQKTFSLLGRAAPTLGPKARGAPHLGCVGAGVLAVQQEGDPGSPHFLLEQVLLGDPDHLGQRAEEVEGLQAQQLALLNGDTPGGSETQGATAQQNPSHAPAKAPSNARPLQRWLDHPVRTGALLQGSQTGPNTCV